MIKEIQISLMESDNTAPSVEKKNRKNFIIRSSAIFEVQKYFLDNYNEVTPSNEINMDLFENFVSSSLDLIYRELIEKTKYDVDTVGIWIDDGSVRLENSMDIELLKEIKKYGTEDIVPMYELYKMTLEEDESEEVI